MSDNKTGPKRSLIPHPSAWFVRQGNKLVNLTSKVPTGRVPTPKK